MRTFYKAYIIEYVTYTPFLKDPIPYAPTTLSEQFIFKKIFSTGSWTASAICIASQTVGAHLFAVIEQNLL